MVLIGMDPFQKMETIRLIYQMSGKVQDFQHMQDLIPLAQSEYFGVDIYLHVLEFIHQIRV